MSIEGNDENFRESEVEPCEGTFDAQLSFPTPFVEAPQPISTVIKRDGREVPYEKQKIADAIFRAAHTLGGQDRDRAESLATGVTIYLSKRLNGRPPTVEQVHDAVEKVLIEMGHARTALAYARYRDKRARMRHLRAGNLRVLLKELAEAEGEPAPASPELGAALSVRTSGESVLEWDRQRIVQALVRETDLEESVAAVIAGDVEQQIVAAGVRTLTAALVRELVDAKLIELGLEEHRRRHARLGVPLFDAERILCAPNGGPGEAGFDPEATNGVLAEQVKKEYALSRVFSQGVADAHLRGDIHLQGLGAVDRIQGIAPALDYVIRFGAGSPEARPPRTLEALFWQTAQFNVALMNHTNAAVRWEALNVYLAPFAAELADNEVRDAARMLMYLLSPARPGPGRSVAALSFGLTWDVPQALRPVEAVGPGGVNTGRAYREYEHDAQRFGRALLDAWREAVEDRGAAAVPTPVVRFSHELWRMPGRGDFLGVAAEAASSGAVEFVLDRSVLPERERSRPWQPWWLALHDVALNLPRLAYGAGDEAGMYDALEAVLDMAVRGHRDKLTFLHKLTSLGEVGPLSLLTARRESQTYMDLDRAVCLVSPVGLNECVQRLVGSELHETEEAMSLGARLLEHVKTWCDRCAEREGIRLTPVHGDDARVATRLAGLDLRTFPDAARAALKMESANHEWQYTPGVGLAPSAGITPMERTRAEGRLHDWVDAVSPTCIRMPDSDLSREAVVDFLRKAFFQSSNARIRFGA